MKKIYKHYLVSGGAVLVGILSRKLLSAAWKKTVGKQPPANPVAPSVTMGEAIAWTLAISVVGGLSNLAFKKLVGEKVDNTKR